MYLISVDIDVIQHNKVEVFQRVFSEIKLLCYFYCVIWCLVWMSCIFQDWIEWRVTSASVCINSIPENVTLTPGSKQANWQRVVLQSVGPFWLEITQKDQDIISRFRVAVRPSLDFVLRLVSYVEFCLQFKQGIMNLVMSYPLFELNSTRPKSDVLDGAMPNYRQVKCNSNIW